jgi:hypothetical protein
MVHSPNGTFAKWHIRQMAHTPTCYIVVFWITIFWENWYQNWLFHQEPLSFRSLLFMEHYSPGNVFYPETIFQEPFGIGSLFHRNVFFWNVSVGTFWQERYVLCPLAWAALVCLGLPWAGLCGGL